MCRWYASARRRPVRCTHKLLLWLSNFLISNSQGAHKDHTFNTWTALTCPVKSAGFWGLKKWKNLFDEPASLLLHPFVVFKCLLWPIFCSMLVEMCMKFLLNGLTSMIITFCPNPPACPLHVYPIFTHRQPVSTRKGSRDIRYCWWTFAWIDKLKTGMNLGDTNLYKLTQLIIMS